MTVMIARATKPGSGAGRHRAERCRQALEHGVAQRVVGQQRPAEHHAEHEDS